eukprot:TRINITY_DN3722_c0_g1_i1.p1 TRINITY_DN3722_c0_g1~~TRINITY_DN3722_c0_g1_i1.p1  ORF type:complete len:1927 (-),score=428.61 TRINITY_DN3722_c0_g1_i1:16-5796(-)
MPNSGTVGTKLELEWVYGYHGSRCRDNLFYIQDDEVVYHLAGVGIVYNPRDHTQRFFQGHTDDIISLTLHPDRRLVATGQIGKDPYIAVWDTKTMTTVALLKHFHQRGICSLGFSHDGKYLVSVGLDDDHTLALWDWKEGRVIAQDKASNERIFDIEPSPYSNTIVTCGVKHIKFWTYSGNSLVQKKGIFGTAGEITTILCIGFGHNDGKTYTGTLTGEVYIWQENRLISVIQAHKGPLYSVDEYDNGFLTGGKDGLLRIWTKDFKPEATVSLGRYNLRSISYSHGKILLGTKTSDILEVSGNLKNPNKRLLIEGHAEGELWGLGMHPSLNMFVTASDDKTIKIWDGHLHKCLLTIPAKTEARSCTFSVDGNFIAVGFLNGSVSVYSSKEGKEVVTLQQRKEEISQVKYSPNGQYLAVASHDNFVDIYDTKQYKRLGTCGSNSSFITHLDWSADSKFIRTNSGDYAILTFEIPSCALYTRSLDIHWNTVTRILGEDVAGIWPPYSDKTDVNALDTNRKRTLCVTGDDFGLVKIFRYPNAKGSRGNKALGHSAHVTNVQWTPDGRGVVTTGGGDQAVLQWRVVQGEDEPPSDADEPHALDSDIEREREIDYEPTKKDKTSAPPSQPDSNAMFAMATTSEVVKSGRPRPNTRGKPKPESGKNLSGHVDKGEPPTTELKLEYVYGYRGFDTRHNLFYTKSREVVFHSAACCVTQDLNHKNQRFFIEHDDDIISLALHPDGTTVATGQVGKDPKIIVWDANSQAKIAVLQGFHQRGVCSLSFSGDGQFLVSVGLDDKHTLGVWDWKKGQLKAQGPGSQEKIMMAQYNPYNLESFVSVGVKHISFWKTAGNGLVGNKGLVGKLGTIQTMLCVAFDKAYTYCGTNDGSIYQFRENNLSRVISGHTGPVFDLCSTPTGFASGGKDGILKLWTSDFGSCTPLDLNKTVAGMTIKALHAQDSCVIVGGASGCILEASQGQVKVVQQGHGLGEMWGLSTHSSKKLFATCSDDKTIKVWDMLTHEMTGFAACKFAARSCGWSPDGTKIAVGFLNGAFSVYAVARELKELCHFKHRNECISDVKFSPNGQLLAVASHDNFVDLYRCDDKWTRVGRCSGNSSFITHIDWTMDSDLLMTNSGDYQRLFFKAPKGERINVSQASIQSTKWASWTGILGDEMAGMWQPNSDGTDINSTDRAHSGDILATGDDFGYVRLFKYPCPEGAAGKKFAGHSAHVTTVRFSYDDNYLLSVGGGDASIFQWKHVHKGEKEIPDDTEEYDSDVEKEKKQTFQSRHDLHEQLVSQEPRDEDEDSPLSFQVGATQTVKSGRPSKAKVDPDVEYHDQGSHSPSIPDLKLKFVYGYRAHDSRNNLFYVSDNEIVYHVAGTGVVMDTTKKSQRHFLEHTDDIVSLAYHRNKNVVATGQVGKQPRVCVWDPLSLKCLAVLKGPQTVAICSLSFSASGTMLVSTDESPDHTVVLWKWKEGIKAAEAPGSKEKIFDVVFHPKKEDEFVTVGVKHVKFWKVTGNALDGKKGIFGKTGSIQTILSACYGDNDDCYTGTISGEIYAWNGNQCVKVIKAHSGPVYSINRLDNGDYISGGKDTSVTLWSSDFGSAKKKLEIECRTGGVPVARSVSGRGGKVVIGTQSSEIYESRNGDKPQLVMEGHADGELWGLATHPSTHTAVTAGDDKTVRVWDLNSKMTLATANLGVAGRSTAVSADGSMVAVGLANGSFTVLEAKTLTEIVKKRNRKEEVSDLRFSPDGKYLAVSSHDNFVDIYSTADWTRTGICKGNSSFITHIDWSKDGHSIQTNSGAYEHLMYESPSGKQVLTRDVGQKLSDAEYWHSFTTVLGTTIAGIWPPNSDKTDVNALDINKRCTFLATGDDFGFVKVFQYPCDHKGAEFKKFVGHSAHVTNVRFTFDDTLLLSVGGGDRALFQWEVKSSM